MKNIVSVSKRLEIVPASPMRKLVPFAVDAKNRGIHVFHLNIGDPDILTPEVMINTLRKWDANPISYDQSQGNPEFINSLVSYYAKLGFPFVQKEHIQVTTGGSEAISMAMFATCEPGDEIIVFEPFYANYNSYSAINSVKLKAIPTSIADGFHLPGQKIIESYISKRTRGILICNPNNPTGTVYTKSEMDMLVSVSKKYGLFLMSDEVYREFVYGKTRHISLFTYFSQIPNQAIVLDSMSKRYSLCGARLGTIVSQNKDIMDGVLRMAQGRLSSGFIDQTVASKLSLVPESYLRSVRTEYEKRRTVLYEGLKSIPGITVNKPEGAFYLIIGLPVRDAEHFCKWLLTDFSDNSQTLMIAPASGFYATKNAGVNEVRIAYVLNIKSLKRSTELLKLALSVYSKSK